MDPFEGTPEKSSLPSPDPGVEGELQRRQFADLNHDSRRCAAEDFYGLGFGKLRV